MGRRLWVGVLMTGATLSGTAAHAPQTSAGGFQPLTPVAALETVRLMLNPEAVTHINPDGAVSISPAGTRWVARLVRGDVQHNGVSLEVISGSMGSVAEATQWRLVARLLSSGRGGGLVSSLGPHQDTSSYATPVRWLDEDRIAFLWSDAQERRQVVSINLSTASVSWLTDHPTSVASFDVREDRVVYNAMAPRPMPPVMSRREGFVVPASTDGYGLMMGDLSGASLTDTRMNTQWFVRRGTAPARELRLTPQAVDLDVRHLIRIAPGGKAALIDVTPDVLPAEWSHYTGADLSQWMAEARREPRSGVGRMVHQLFVVDLEQGSARALWSAATLASLARAEWSPLGDAVVVAPTGLPSEERDVRGREARAAAVVNVRTGGYEILPIELSVDRPPAVLRFVKGDLIEIGERDGNVMRLQQVQRTASGWQRRTAPPGAASAPVAAPAVRLYLTEDLNTPPRLTAAGSDGTTRVLLDLNPQLQRHALGRVAQLRGVLPSGDTWAALLFYPAAYEPQRRYPLVIQSVYGRAPTEKFTLYGEQSAGLGPPVIAAYPGQLLAARDMVVLHLNVSAGAKSNTPEEAPLRQLAFESVVTRLAESGLIDPARVGLLGFSRNGYYVEYTLTHSSFPFAAAISADNWDPSYLQQTLTGHWADASAVNGGEPFGAGLQRWLSHAPGFNADQVRTPLRMVEQSHGGTVGILGKWELYSRLRHLRKPVEFFIMPDIAQGAHNTQNPAQILAVQQGSVDWFDFWLNGREDPAPHKVEQYRRWRLLRDQQRASRSRAGAALH